MNGYKNSAILLAALPFLEKAINRTSPEKEKAEDSRRFNQLKESINPSVDGRSPASEMDSLELARALKAKHRSEIEQEQLPELPQEMNSFTTPKDKSKRSFNELMKLLSK